MDQERFFYEVDREQAEIEQINGDLQELATEACDEEIEMAYAEFLQVMLHSFYEECFAETEWEV